MPLLGLPASEIFEDATSGVLKRASSASRNCGSNDLMNLPDRLPSEKSGTLFLTDGGMETTLVFHEGLDLPCFAAFPLLELPQWRQWMREYYLSYITLARRSRCGFVLETPTWRANPAWGKALQLEWPALAEANRKAVEFLKEIRQEEESESCPMPISGCLGPRGEGYSLDQRFTPEEYSDFHAAQISWLKEAGVDFVTAMTMNHLEEAIGVALAARSNKTRCVISFTVETNGALADGTSLEHAVRSVDATAPGAVEYFMINCAHPSHFSQVIEGGLDWAKRILGLRANASKLSHAELEASTVLDAGEPEDFGRLYAALRKTLPELRVFGGCCGTDHRHIAAICRHAIF